MSTTTANVQTDVTARAFRTVSKECEPWGRRLQGRAFRSHCGRGYVSSELRLMLSPVRICTRMKSTRAWSARRAVCVKPTCRWSAQLGCVCKTHGCRGRLSKPREQTCLHVLKPTRMAWSAGSVVCKNRPMRPGWKDTRGTQAMKIHKNGVVDPIGRM